MISEIIFNRNIIYCFLFGAFFSVNSLAENHTINSIVNIIPFINSLSKKYNPQDILLVFDIDLTLTVSQNKAVQWPNIEKHKKIIKEIEKTLTNYEKALMWNLATKLTSQKLINQKTPNLLRTLQIRGIKIIILSNSWTGSLSSIKRIEKWRYKTLNNLGINVKNTFPIKEIIFTEFALYRDYYPVFFQGILCTNSKPKENSKGQVLIAFLKHIQLFPKFFVIVDDKKEDISQVLKMMSKYSPYTRVLGLELTEGSRYQDGIISEEEFRSFWLNQANQAKEISLDFKNIQ